MTRIMIISIALVVFAASLAESTLFQRVERQNRPSQYGGSPYSQYPAPGGHSSGGLGSGGYNPYQAASQYEQQDSHSRYPPQGSQYVVSQGGRPGSTSGSHRLPQSNHGRNPTGHSEGSRYPPNYGYSG